MEELLSDDEARLVLKRILSLYPDAKGELNWDTKFHLLCAVLMSALIKWLIEPHLNSLRTIQIVPL